MPLIEDVPMYQSKKEVAIRGVSVEKSASSARLTPVVLITSGAAALTAGSAQAAITVPAELLEVFSDLAVAFGTLMAAGAVLFGVIRGGVALFKIASKVFGAAGA